jgi:hypothetical protein
MIRNKIEQEFDIIDLTGPDGNAFVLLGKAKALPSGPVKSIISNSCSILFLIISLF